MGGSLIGSGHAGDHVIAIGRCGLPDSWESDSLTCAGIKKRSDPLPHPSICTPASLPLTYHKMDKQAFLKHPFHSKGRAALREGRNTDIHQVDEKDRKELRERDAWDKLGYSCGLPRITSGTEFADSGNPLRSFPTWRKWQILFIMFMIQISINLNASLYANGVVCATSLLFQR